MRKGVITDWNDEKGFGFVTPLEGGRKTFFRISAYPFNSVRPSVGQHVSFSYIPTERGDRATTIIPDTGTRQVMRTGILVRMFTAILVLTVVCILTIWGRIPSYGPGVYALTSILGFGVYGFDKHRAEAGEWRIPENNLHLISLLGGWPGALIGQQVFRHKTQKTSFQSVFWVTVAVNCIALAAMAVFGVDSLNAWMQERAGSGF